MNDWWSTLFAAVALVVCVGGSLWAARRAHAPERLRRYAAAHGLPELSADDAEAVMRAQRRTSLWLIPPLAVVIIVMWLATLVVGLPAPTGSYIMILVPLIITASATGGLVSALAPVFRPRPGTPRIARAVAVSAEDLIGPAPVRASTVLAVVGAVVCLAGAVVTASLGFLAATVLDVAVLVIGGAVVVGLRAVERRVLERPQPTSDPVQLAWGDVFSAETVMMLRVGVAQVGLVAIVVPVAIMFAGQDSPTGDAVAGTLTAVCFAAVVGVQAWFQLTTAHRIARGTVTA